MSCVKVERLFDDKPVTHKLLHWVNCGDSLNRQAVIVVAPITGDLLAEPLGNFKIATTIFVGKLNLRYNEALIFPVKLVELDYEVFERNAVTRFMQPTS